MTLLIDVLNGSNPNKLPSAMQAVGVGDAFASNAQFFGGAVSLNILSLPAPAAGLLKVFRMAGAALGPCTFVAESATPAAGQCRINAAGNIEFAAADAVTSAYAYYCGEEGKRITETVSVVGSAASFASNRALKVISANVITGVVLGSKPASAQGVAPALGFVSLTNACTGVTFNAGDVVAGQASVTYIAMPGFGAQGASVSSKLQQDVGF